jgi:DNA-nicking Smr family endonuclease
MKLSTLEELAAIKKRFPKKNAPSTPTAPRPSPPRPAPPQVKDDAALFAQAMSDVVPLSKNLKGRRIANPVPPRESPWPDEQGPGEDCWVANYLRNLVQGRVEFKLSYSEEYMHGHIHGLDRKILEKLKAGQFSVESHLDLHGYNALQARDAAYDYLRVQYQLGRRCVLLIPGRGRNSPGGQALIREELPLWMTRDPLRRVILAFCTALPQHGGAGAVYVLLRKRKKTQGKIRWDLPASME